MSGQVIFPTHADLVIAPAVPMPDWDVNETGHTRHTAFAETADLSAVKSAHASTEQKARDGAAPIPAQLDLPHPTDWRTV